MKFLYDAAFPEIESWVKTNGHQQFNARQIYAWIGKGITSFDEMTNLSKRLRKDLSESYYVDGLKTEQKYVSEIDGTIKYVFKLKDGNVIESVLMRYNHGNSVCISSQAGCKMGCTFCASAKAGFGRNLSFGEMLAQVAVISRDTDSRISNVVIMGIGEPFDNYEQLILFLHAVNDPEGLGIGMRHISVSTCGLVDEMLKFTNEGLPVTLSISLHAPNDALRKAIMPIASRYSIDQLMAACRKHVQKTGRRITFEYTLLKGVNDSPTNARELAGRLKGLLCHVNLIPANEFKDSGFSKSSTGTIKEFQKILVDNNINATIRRELGSDIMAACGQLRRGSQEGDTTN